MLRLWNVCTVLCRRKWVRQAGQPKSYGTRLPRPRHAISSSEPQTGRYGALRYRISFYFHYRYIPSKHNSFAKTLKFVCWSERCWIIECRCSGCGDLLLSRQFYLFSCNHRFHSDCLIDTISLHLAPARWDHRHTLHKSLTLVYGTRYLPYRHLWWQLLYLQNRAE